VRTSIRIFLLVLPTVCSSTVRSSAFRSELRLQAVRLDDPNGPPEGGTPNQTFEGGTPNQTFEGGTPNQTSEGGTPKRPPEGGTPKRQKYKRFQTIFGEHR